jgi:raffinose/stachyose/melibiose transport system substrate-binding protein
VIGSVITASALVLTACSGGGSTAASGGSFTMLALQNNTTPNDTLAALSSSTCQAADKAAPLKKDADAQTQHDQKLQLLAGQNALPNIFVGPGTPDLAKQFISGNKLVDITAELQKEGLQDQILPVAQSTIQKLYGKSDSYALPNELNIEGIWYNKKIFSDNGIALPGTWDELTADAAALLAKGIQPFAGDGKDGWPITRYVGAYIFRSLGPDALEKVAQGKAKLTDPEYVKAANEVAKLGKAGAFGAGVASTDYNGGLNQFLTGKAAMDYMGSWALANFNDPKQNTVGADNIGFMPFPAVSGGKGSIDQTPANVGQPIMMSKSKFGSGSAAWLKCIAQDYGNVALDKYGVVTGFKITKQPGNVPPLTKVVQDQINSSTSSVLWFEALFNAKATTVSQSDGGSLGNGSLSGSDFMQQLQTALGQ